MANEDYSKVAATMSLHDQYAIFRRFSKLNYQNLLYMQAELCHLEKRLDELAHKDQVEFNCNSYASDWLLLSQSNAQVHEEQRKLMLEIREKLKDYNDQLQHSITLSSVRKPRKHQIKKFRMWLSYKTMGNDPLKGIDKESWSEKHVGDLFSANKPERTDALSRFALRILTLIFFEFVGKKTHKPDPTTGAVYYTGRPVRLGVNALVTVLAAMILMASIRVLNFVSKTIDRLAITTTFSAIFVLALTTTTRAKRVEVFATTTAARFAAIQVVFVSNNPGSSTNVSTSPTT